jgi:peptide/nickel transport system substrate-binding protein
LPESRPEAIAREDLQLFSSAQPSYINITLNLDNPNVPFFQETEVRQALLYALDREALIQDVAAGQGIIAHSPILPDNWAFNPDVTRYPYDPARARALLEQAGWVDTNGDGIREKDGVPLQFVLHTNDDATRSALIARIAEYWAQVGVLADATPVTFAGLVNDLLAPRTFEAVLIGWETPGDPDPYPLWHSTQVTGAGQNYSGWQNEQADRVMEQARAELDESARKELYGEFQQIFSAEVPALLLYYPVYTYGVSMAVNNVQMGALNHPSQRFESFADWYMETKRVPATQAQGLTAPTPPAGTAGSGE